MVVLCYCYLPSDAQQNVSQTSSFCPGIFRSFHMFIRAIDRQYGTTMYLHSTITNYDFAVYLCRDRPYEFKENQEKEKD